MRLRRVKPNGMTSPVLEAVTSKKGNKLCLKV
jgi:hypothetical protein